jgi:hypothetical protein
MKRLNKVTVESKVLKEESVEADLIKKVLASESSVLKLVQ